MDRQSRIQPMDSDEEDKYHIDVGDSNQSLVSNRQSARLPDIARRFEWAELKNSTTEL